MTPCFSQFFSLVYSSRLSDQLEKIHRIRRVNDNNVVYL